MELQQVRYVLAVQETRNFTRAAERCAVSQPALTASIRKLEEELEAPLFHRDRSGTKLTTLGQALLPHFERLAKEALNVGQIAKNNVLLKGVPLKVGAQSTVGPGCLARYIESFREKAAASEVEIRFHSQQELLAQLEEAELDLAICSRPGAPPDWLVARRLYEERYVVALPPRHTLAAESELSLKALDGEPYVDRLACELRERVAAACAAAGVELYASYRTAQEAWIESLVRAGVGFAFLPEFSVLSTDTVTRPLKEPALSREICLLRSADHPVSAICKLFWDTVVDAANADSKA